MSLGSTAGQLLDKLSDLIVGPVQGTIVAAALDGTVVVPQGLQATLPDGRVVRVVAAKRVGVSGTPVKVRLLYLAPSSPTAGNFVVIGAGLVATWQAGIGASGPVAVPTGLAPTGTTTPFGYTARAATLRIGSCTEASDVKTEEDLFAAGSQGGASLIVLDPVVKNISRGGLDMAGEARLQFRDATWKIRVNVSTLQPQKERRVRARDISDNLTAMLQGATVGDGELRVEEWKLVRRKAGVDSWELTVATQLYEEGRVLQPEAVAGLSMLADLDAFIELPGDDLQPAPFRVRTTTGTGNGFSDGFSDGFG